MVSCGMRRDHDGSQYAFSWLEGMDASGIYGEDSYMKLLCLPYYTPLCNFKLKCKSTDVVVADLLHNKLVWFKAGPSQFPAMTSGGGHMTSCLIN